MGTGPQLLAKSYRETDDQALEAYTELNSASEATRQPLSPQTMTQDGRQNNPNMPATVESLLQQAEEVPPLGLTQQSPVVSDKAR